jgi:hypothetical protein
MAKLDTVSMTDCPTRVPIAGSHDHDQKDPSERRALYVLGFGIAGAILANALLFIRFASLSASG